MGITIFKILIWGSTFGNHVLRIRSCVAIKLNFRPYILQYTSPNENFEYSYPLINQERAELNHEHSKLYNV